MVDTQESGTESARSLRERFDAHGFTFAHGLLSADEVQQLREALTPLLQTARAGVRDLLRQSSAVAALARSAEILNTIGKLTDAAPFAVRGILFDKAPAANWRVTWHQDLTIAVKMRAESPEFGSWSVKGGVHHAQAPSHVLQRMLTVRVHLDEADKGNGALEVVPGSHLFGKLDDGSINRVVSAGPVTTCAAHAGDVFVMRPLLLHSSCPATLPRHRRVIHLEYATEELPSPLEWFERVS